MSGRDGSSGDLTAPFLFVPTGDPEPTAWMAAHPDWIKIPATLVPRRSASSEAAVPPGTEMAAVAGTEAAAAPWIAAGIGAGFIGGVGELLAAAAPPLAFLGVLLRPSRTQPPEWNELHPGGEGFDPHPAMPPLPGLVPPVAGDPRPGEGGFTPIAPTPPQPGFDPALPSPNVLPGRTVEAQGPTILQQDRNDGLVAGARTSSQRAREAARAADPAVTQALPDAEWRAHHLINVAGLRTAPKLIAAAERAGWRTDDPANVAPLPASPEAQKKLKTAGINRPVHDSGHRNWNDEVRVGLELILDDLRNQGLTQDNEAYGREARRQLERLQDDLRQKMMQEDRLTQNGTTSQSAFV